jgi:Ca-activated chloride channel family protein
MTFLWPEMLSLLLLAPALAAAYAVLLCRRKKHALRYASLAFVKEAMGASQHVRRHLPPLLFLFALTLMIIAIARPAAVVTLASQHKTVILAVDVSVSMRADDVAPSRIEAAKASVRRFVGEQPRTTSVGIVSFAGAAALVRAPTRNREEILSALNALELQMGTAVGSGILESLRTIFPDIKFELPARNSFLGRPSFGASLDRTPKPQTPAPPPVPAGSYGSAVIILLTDGQSTTGPDPIAAARLAADRGVRVYTVGIGTPSGEIMVGEGWTMRVRLDEESLKRIAAETKGEYFYADNAADLTKIYNTLNSKLVLEKKETEVSALFIAAALLLAVISAALSMQWASRLD